MPLTHKSRATLQIRAAAGACTLLEDDIRDAFPLGGDPSVAMLEEGAQLLRHTAVSLMRYADQIDKEVALEKALRK